MGSEVSLTKTDAWVFVAVAAGNREVNDLTTVVFSLDYLNRDMPSVEVFEDSVNRLVRAGLITAGDDEFRATRAGRQTLDRFGQTGVIQIMFDLGQEWDGTRVPILETDHSFSLAPGAWDAAQSAADKLVRDLDRKPEVAVGGATRSGMTVLRYWKPWRLALFAVVGLSALGATPLFTGRLLDAAAWELPVVAAVLGVGGVFGLGLLLDALRVKSTFRGVQGGSLVGIAVIAVAALRIVFGRDLLTQPFGQILLGVFGGLMLTVATAAGIRLLLLQRRRRLGNGR